MTSIHFEQVLMVAYPHWGYREAPCKREVTEAFIAMPEHVLTHQRLSKPTGDGRIFKSLPSRVNVVSDLLPALVSDLLPSMVSDLLPVQIVRGQSTIFSSLTLCHFHT